MSTPAVAVSIAFEKNWAEFTPNGSRIPAIGQLLLVASHGWPSFRDEEVVWDNVRCLKDGECVSVDGTHLGHNLPDGRGNRYCINLVSVAGEAERKE